MESVQRRVIWRLSAQAEREEQELSTKMEFLQEERVIVRKASVVEMRLFGWKSSVISRNSEAHLIGAMLVGVREMGRS